MPPVEPRPAHGVLVLWDVDHTLIETRGVGLAIYRRVFASATGQELDVLAQVSGRTELEIMCETLLSNGMEASRENVATLVTALVDGYERARDELATIGRELPGARATLERLAAIPQVQQGVLTGNLRDVARIKLEVFELDRYVDLDCGAYGDDHHERAELVAIAQRRASARTGLNFDAERTVLIGDTPKDVEAGTTAGVRVIAVASGKSSAESLRRAGATAVVDSLTDPEHISHLVENVRPLAGQSE